MPDTLIYNNGKPIEFQPAQGEPPTGRDALEIRIRRPGQPDDANTWGLWLPKPPPLPPITTYRPTSEPRGDGIRLSGNATLRDVHYDGWRQNIVAENCGSVTLDNVRSTRAKRVLPSDKYKGQGLYADKCGPLVVRNSYMAWNGYTVGDPFSLKSQFRHAIYADDESGRGGTLIEDSIFAFNASCGAQLRNGGVVRRCVFVGNAIGILAVRGDVLIEDCVFLGASYHCVPDERGQFGSWTAHSAISSYTPNVRVRNCVIAGDGKVAPPSNLPSWCIGALNTGDDHDKNPGVKGSLIVEGVTVSGWRQRNVPGTTILSGTVTTGDKICTFDPMPVLRDVEANNVAVRDAVALLSEKVRQSV